MLRVPPHYAVACISATTIIKKKIMNKQKKMKEDTVIKERQGLVP